MREELELRFKTQKKEFTDKLDSTINKQIKTLKAGMESNLVKIRASVNELDQRITSELEEKSRDLTLRVNNFDDFVKTSVGELMSQVHNKQDKDDEMRAQTKV